MNTEEINVLRLRREHLDWSSLRIAQTVGMSRPWVAAVLQKHCLSTVSEVLAGLPIIRRKNVEPEINQHLPVHESPIKP